MAPRALLLLCALLARGAAASSHKHGHRLMRSYRRTSHSLAMSVARPTDAPELDSWFRSRHRAGFTANAWFKAVGKSLEEEEKLPHQPWWWIVAVKKSGSAEVPWDDLREKFRHNMSEGDKAALIAGLSRTRGLSDDFGIDDPKLQTLNMADGQVFFRAVPQGRCDSRTHPPRASFLPRILPPVDEGFCVLEICGLDPNMEYKLLLFNISDGEDAPQEKPEPLAEAHAKTADPAMKVKAMKIVLLVACIVAMIVALLLPLRDACAQEQQPASYSNVALVSEGVSGFHQTKVRNLFLQILQDMLLAMTMFLPIVGPVGLVLASDIVLGTRLERVKQSREEYARAEEQHKMGQLWQLVKDVWNVLINIVFIPFNMYTVQLLWATYLHSWYGRYGFDSFQDSSYTDVQKYGNQWEEVSGLELGGWVPAVVLSTLLLALERQNDQVTPMLEKHRQRAESHLTSLTKGKELWGKLCRMEGKLFGTSPSPPDGLPARFRRLLLGVTFAVLPHAWMWLRHSVPLVGSPMLWYTLMYLVNISGVTIRFLALCDRIHWCYKHNCTRLAFLQALSWQEDMSTAIYDPFATRNHAVMESRRKLRENIPRISSLKLEEPEDSKVWWHLRGLVFIQIKDGRILMEMMVLMSIWMALLLGVSSLVVLKSLEEMTAITIVTPVVMVVLLRFTYIALALARDINLMYLEHTSLLHNIVGEMNMPLRPSMPLDSHLQQERFLLQVATLIEKQPPPETLASFAVTPQLLSFVVGVVGILTAVSLYNLATGLVSMKSS